MQNVLVFCLFVAFSVLTFWLVPKSILELCDLSKCPFCYGDSLCADIKRNKISLEYNSFSKLFFNIFSVKNIYFALYGDKSVILKKLAHENELSALKLYNSNCSKNEIRRNLNGGANKNFKLCNGSSDAFLQNLKYTDIRNICTILLVNVEPIIFDFFSRNDNWSVPELYGFCGRLVVVENAGEPLNSIKNYDWYQRAYVAYQILTAARNFTENHKTFRLYLTDISPDNIVVNHNLEVRFIDLGNVVMKTKGKRDIIMSNTHYSENFDEDNFIFSETQICESELSDHNIFAVCKVCKI